MRVPLATKSQTPSGYVLTAGVHFLTGAPRKSTEPSAESVVVSRSRRLVGVRSAVPLRGGPDPMRRATRLLLLALPISSLARYNRCTPGGGCQGRSRERTLSAASCRSGARLEDFRAQGPYPPPLGQRLLRSSTVVCAAEAMSSGVGHGHIWRSEWKERKRPPIS